MADARTLAERIIESHRRGASAFGGNPDEVMFLDDDYRLARLVLDELLPALENAERIFGYIEANDRSVPYGYGEPRPNGDLPEPGAAFNTPREFARYWRPIMQAALARVGDTPQEVNPDGAFGRAIADSGPLKWKRDDTPQGTGR